MEHGIKPESLNAVYQMVIREEITWSILFLDYDIKIKKTDASYDYYIHYEGFNRRMDEWIPITRIKAVTK